jgi:acetyl-CoA carboxylase carboxyltransferase component
MNGRPVGLVANQPKILAGVLDGDASRKAARFVRFCDAFNIPIITLADVPGFLCGTQQEYSGVITQGAKLIYAYGEATVPKVTVVLRKAYGGAYVSMGCKQLGGDVNFAWPSAQIAVMGAESAAEVISSRPQDFIEDYKSRISNPQNAIENGSLDEIIEPSTTRRRVIDALEKISATRPAALWKKHDNMPL